MADMILAITLLSYPLGGLQGTGEGCRNSMGTSHTTAPGSLAALSRDGTGEAERKPWGRGLKTNRMVHWLAQQEEGRLRNRERWEEYIQVTGQLRETRATSNG